MNLTFPRQVSYLILLGFFLRLLFTFFSLHLYYPDEVFQSLEPALRLVKGYGIIPWDIAYGLRSGWFIAFSAIPLWLLQLLHLEQLNLVHFATNLWFIIFSVSVIPATFRLTSLVQSNTQVNLLATFAATVWYELIYFSPRALSECLSLYLLALAIISYQPSTISTFRSCLFASFSLFLRPQLFPLSLAWIYFTYRSSTSRLRSSLFSAVLFSVCLILLSDSLYYNQLHFHQLQNIYISFFLGANKIFGVLPIWSYLLLLIGGSSLFFILALLPSRPQIKYLSSLYLGIILVHSLIPHKEYRFLFGLIPITLLLAIHNLYHQLRRQAFLTIKVIPILIVSLTLVLSLLGIAHQLPYQNFTYPNPPLFKDSYLITVQTLKPTPTICGLQALNRSWVHTGGSWFVGQPTPLYDTSNPPYLSPANLIISHEPQTFPQWQLQSQIESKTIGSNTIFPVSYLYLRPSACQLQAYTWYRSFPLIEKLIQNNHIQPKYDYH